MQNISTSCSSVEQIVGEWHPFLTEYFKETQYPMLCRFVRSAIKISIAGQKKIPLSSVVGNPIWKRVGHIDYHAYRARSCLAGFSE